MPFVFDVPVTDELELVAMVDQLDLLGQCNGWSVGHLVIPGRMDVVFKSTSRVSYQAM